MPAIDAEQAPPSVIIKYKTIARDDRKRGMVKAGDWLC